MSQNNQTLLVEYRGKFYVFPNTMAESWCKVDDNGNIIEGRNNELSLKSGIGPFNSRNEALEVALKIEREDEWGGTKYGVQFNRLVKDDANVKIVE